MQVLGSPSRLWRHTLRIDGFVSAHTDNNAGESAGNRRMPTFLCEEDYIAQQSVGEPNG